MGTVGPVSKNILRGKACGVGLWSDRKKVLNEGPKGSIHYYKRARNIPFFHKDKRNLKENNGRGRRAQTRENSLEGAGGGDKAR